MTYDITTKTAPAMPKLGKGLDFVKLVLSQVSPDMREPIAPTLFDAAAAHISATEFLYPDQSWKELCGMIDALSAGFAGGKGQLQGYVEAMMRFARKHDELELQKLVEWQRNMKSKGANKEKPIRPDVSFWFPPSDVTNAAFIQNAMACELGNAHTQYYNMPEVEMADKICGGHKQVTQTIRNIYDKARAGALRATAEGVTGNPVLRVNMNISCTPGEARNFFKRDLFNGTLGRVAFSYKARGNRDGRIPRQGKYDEDFLKKLDAYIVRLQACKGRHVVQPLNKLADRLALDMAALADLTDDDTLWDMSKRSIVNAWKKGCVLYILNGMTWTKGMGDFVEWLVYFDLWSKSQIFGDMFKEGSDSLGDAQKSGPKNMLCDLPNTFNEAQLEALRVSLGKSSEGTRGQLNVWKNRNFITYSAQTGLYSKTQEYLTGNVVGRGTKGK